MALKTLFGAGAGTATKFVIANRLAEGESVEGYLVGFTVSTHSKFAKPIIVLQRADGSQFDVTADGNLKYVQQDAEAKGITTGAKTVITRTGTKKTNFGPSGLFSVAQDTDDVIEVEALATPTTTKAPDAGLASNPNLQTVEARMAQLKKSTTAKKA